MKWIKTPALALALSTVLTVSGYGALPEQFPVAANTQPAVQQESALSVPAGEILEFTAADLERRIGLAEESLSGVTVTALPGAGQGSLVLEGVEVELYQFLTRDEVDELCYVPEESTLSASITLLPQGMNNRQTTLSISVLHTENRPPVAEGASLATVKDMPLYGAVTVSDPDGDATDIVVVAAPKKGGVKFDGHRFLYTPFSGKTGNDRFVFCAVDRFGNYSQEAVVDIKIESNRSGFYFVDMQTHPSAYAAVKLQEKGVLSGRQIGSGWFFQPNREVTRSELLVMVLAVSGMDGSLSPTVNTGLDNDASLPMWLKPYIDRAMEEGVWSRSQAFVPDQVPTRAEAVQMVALAAKIDDVKDFPLQAEDIADIPEWALDSYKELAAYRMLDLHDGAAHPDAALDNAYAATLLWQLYKHTHR